MQNPLAYCILLSLNLHCARRIAYLWNVWIFNKTISHRTLYITMHKQLIFADKNDMIFTLRQKEEAISAHNDSSKTVHLLVFPFRCCFSSSFFKGLCLWFFLGDYYRIFAWTGSCQWSVWNTWNWRATKRINTFCHTYCSEKNISTLY